MRRQTLFVAAWLSASCLPACPSSPSSPAPSPADGGSALHPAPNPVTDPVTGDVTISVVVLGAGTLPDTLSAGIPFSVGELAEPGFLQVFQGSTELARRVRVLARWPDKSLRSVLVEFTAPAPVATPVSLRLRGVSPRVLPGEATMVRSPLVRASAPAQRWASTGALGLPVQNAQTGSLAPAFFRRAAAVFQDVSNPPRGSDAEPHVRNYYDHVHALYSHMMSVGISADLLARIDDEVTTYREGEIQHSGARRGTYSARPDTETTTPIDFNIVRRMYALGLVEDYLVNGDARSLAVAQEIADAFVADVARQTPSYPWTERVPAWTILSLIPVYEVTGNASYLAAARTVGSLSVSHQDAMAAKYPSQAGVSGLTGAFIQDRRGAWFDVNESTGLGAGSPFMTTLLVEALYRLYRASGDAIYLQSATKAVRWLKEGCFVPASDRSTSFTADPDPATDDEPSLHTASFRYVCRARDNRTALPGLNPMFAFALGLGWQRTGDESYRTMAREVMAAEAWGYTIKEYNQSLRGASQGFFLLESPAGHVVPLQ